MAVSQDFRDYVIEQLGRVVGVEWKRMFGGVGLYADEMFFALIDDDVVYFKVGDLNRADFESAGSRPFRPYGDERVSMSYYELPVDVLEDPGRLRTWIEKSLAVAKSAAATKQRKKSRPTSSGKKSKS
jgi:DNA transformation protein